MAAMDNCMRFVIKHRDVIVPAIVGAISNSAVEGVTTILEAALNKQTVEKQFVVAEESVAGGKVQYVDKITYTTAIKNRIHSGNAERYDDYRDELHHTYHDDCDCGKKSKKKKNK